MPYTVERVLANTQPLEPLRPALEKGKIRVQRMTYACSGSQEDVIGIPLPKGARVIGGWIASEDLGTSVTLVVKVSDGTTSYTLLAATSFATATKKELPDAAGAIALYSVTGLDGFYPVITIGGANPTAGKKIAAELFYVVE